MNQTHNEVYNVFVQDENDLLGMIAYSLYKSDKIQKITELKEAEASDEEIQLAIFELKRQAIEKYEDYSNKAITIAESFADSYIVSTIVEEKYKATLLAENRDKAKKLHLIFSIVWGLGILMLFGALALYLNYTKDSSIYKLGLSFKNQNEVLLYLFEKFSRRIFVIGAIFFAIRILWINFKMSFKSLITNMHYSDNLRVFDYVKNQCKNSHDDIIKDTLKYVFVDTQNDFGNTKDISLSKTIISTIEDKIKSVVEVKDKEDK